MVALNMILLLLNDSGPLRLFDFAGDYRSAVAHAIDVNRTIVIGC